MLEPLNPTRRRAGGLTLVELAVAIAILVTTATLAVPWLAEQAARQRVRAAAEALASDLQEARFAAAQRGATVHLTFAAGPSWCWAQSTTPDCDCRVTQACRTRVVADSDHRGVQLVQATTARFAADGTGQGSAELRSARGHLLRVEVGALGRARLCSPGGADPRHPAC